MRLPYTFLHPYFFSLYFPEWSANCFERLLKKNTKRTPRGPIVLLSDTRGTPIVERCSLQLKTHGITEGTPLELAKILHPCLEIGRFQPKEDYEALKRLALWAVKFTPLVGIEQQHSGLILNITGTDRVHKGFQTLATRIFRALDGTGITTRIGGATTLGGAWALGRHGKHPITLSSPSMPRKERALFFAPLPLTALRISETTETQLAELGIYTIGDALKLPRKKLALRFGIRFIRALDQLLGDTPEPLLTVQTPEELCCEKEFDPPLLNRQHIVAEALSIFSAVLTRSQELHRKPFL
ncbi:MAG: DNA polymerase Y family protein, partial [Bdellovibrionales bacterium]|nr:DNA polymerase Y family protein [Bdellovibrionales bacterium]